MFTFTSVHPKYTIWGKPVNGVPEYSAKFVRNGSVGIFITEDEQLAEKLRQHPEFNKRFTEMGKPPKSESNVIEGVRSSATQPELGKEKIDPQKFIRFGVLHNKLLKKDGTYRADCTPEEKSEYEQLKSELEV